MVLKLEREVYGTSRPRQLARRDDFLRIGDPIELGRFVPCYLQDPQLENSKWGSGFLKAIR